MNEVKENGTVFVGALLMELLINNDNKAKVSGRNQLSDTERKEIRLAAYTLNLQDMRITMLEDENERLKKAASDAS